jgi:hypothetical protein
MQSSLKHFKSIQSQDALLNTDCDMKFPRTDGGQDCRADRAFIAKSLAGLAFLCVARMAMCLWAPGSLYARHVLLADLVGLAAAVIFSLLGWFYLHVRIEKTLGLMLFLPAFICIMSVFSITLQFIVFYFGASYPIVDEYLAQVDKQLWFDWVYYFNILICNKLLFELTKFSYNSIWYQPLTLAILFIISHRVFDFCRLHLALSISFFLACIGALLMPALGAYQFHGMSPGRHAEVTLAFTDGMTAPILWLRQSEVPAIMPSFEDIRLITFPSLHASAAVIFVLVAWPLRGYRWMFCAVNGLMLLATPVHGSHYLIDVIVGGGLGAVSVALGSLVLGRRPVVERFSNLPGALESYAHSS